MSISDVVLIVTAAIVLCYTVESRLLRLQQSDEFRVAAAAFFDFEIVTSGVQSGKIWAKNTSRNSAYHPSFVWYDAKRGAYILSDTSLKVIQGQSVGYFSVADTFISRSETRHRLRSRYPLLHQRAVSPGTFGAGSGSANAGRQTTISATSRQGTVSGSLLPHTRQTPSSALHHTAPA
jgi:hypothetical protein